MVLADLGADVVTVDRADRACGAPSCRRAAGNVYGRGRRSVGVDLKSPDGRRGGGPPGRPGRRVRRGLPARAWPSGWASDPTRCGPQPPAGLRPHDRLGPGRAAGGQGRPRHQLRGPGRAAGPHRPGRPAADAAAQPARRLRRRRPAAGPRRVRRRSSSGRRRAQGQVVDAAMVDGAALLSAAMAPAYTMGVLHRGAGHEPARLGRPVLRLLRDRRRPVALGRRARAAVLRRPAHRPRTGRRPTAWPGGAVPDRDDQATWPALRARFTEVFAARTLDDWLDVFADLDACVAPVLPFSTAPDDPHLAARGTWVDVERRRAAGAGAPLRPHARPRSTGRRHRPATTPTRSWPRPASRPTRSPRSASPRPIA